MPSVARRCISTSASPSAHQHHPNGHDQHIHACVRSLPHRPRQELRQILAASAVGSRQTWCWMRTRACLVRLRLERCVIALAPSRAEGHFWQLTLLLTSVRNCTCPTFILHGLVGEADKPHLVEMQRWCATTARPFRRQQRCASCVCCHRKVSTDRLDHLLITCACLVVWVTGW